MPKLQYRAIYDFFKITPDTNFGEVLGVAVNSKGNVIVLNHPGTATSGPLYGNATTQLLEFDANGKFVREWGKGVYGLGYAHSVRFDRYDNLWVVDKGTDSVMKFNPAGFVVMNLGRRPEGYEGHYDRPPNDKAVPRDGYFNGVSFAPEANALGQPLVYARSNKEFGTESDVYQFTIPKPGTVFVRAPQPERLTSDRRLMGEDTNHRVTTTLAWTVAVLISLLNVVLIYLTVL